MTGNRGPAWLEQPFLAIARLAWPMAVSMLSYSLMTLADTFFVAKISQAALAGAGLGGVAAFLLVCFPMGLLRGVKVLVSQATGAGERDEVKRYVAAGLVAAGGLGFAALVAGELVAPWLAKLGSTAQAGAHAHAYLAVRSVGAPIVLVYVALREARYGIGDTRSPMVASLLGNVVNIILDALFVLVCGLGVAGAAWATVIGSTVELGVLAALSLAAPGFRPRMMTAQHLAAMWRIGFPTGVQFLLELGAFAMLTMLIASVSELDMAAHQIVLHVVHLSFLPAFAFGEAASVLAGQAVGAGRDDAVRGIGLRALAMAALYTGLCSLAFAGFAADIAALFRGEEDLIATAVRLLYIAAVFQIADGANVVGRSVLRGTGDVRYAAVVGVVTSWVCLPPLAYLLGHRLGLGASGAWLGLCVEIFAGALLFWWRLWVGGWRDVAAASRADLHELARANRAGPPSASRGAPQATGSVPS